MNDNILNDGDKVYKLINQAKGLVQNETLDTLKKDKGKVFKLTKIIYRVDDELNRKQNALSKIVGAPIYMVMQKKWGDVKKAINEKDWDKKCEVILDVVENDFSIIAENSCPVGVALGYI
jgi:hypothetical protein